MRVATVAAVAIVAIVVVWLVPWWWAYADWAVLALFAVALTMWMYERTH